MIGFALVASILGASARGSAVAFGLVIGLVCGVIVLSVHAALYWIGYLFISRSSLGSAEMDGVKSPMLDESTEVSP